MDWKPAGTDTRFCKIGAYGTQGSGKTTTMTMVAGLIARLIGKTSVYMLDSEGGSDFVADILHRSGIKLLAIKTREFSELVEQFESMKETGNVLLVDSVTHFNNNMNENFLKARNKKSIELRDWSVLNDTWRMFTKLFVSSQLHAVICGRVGYEYESIINPDGRMEFYKSDSKMKAADQLGHEPALLVRMEQLDSALAKEKFLSATSKEDRLRAIQDMRASSTIDFVATIEKDRTWLLQGKRFVFSSSGDRMADAKAVEDAFLPFIEWHLKNPSHGGIADNGSTQRLLTPTGNEFQWQETKRRRSIALEEIEGQMVRFIPGVTGKDKAVKVGILEQLYGTRSWTKISEETSIERLQQTVAKDPGHPEQLSILEQACQSATQPTQGGPS